MPQAVRPSSLKTLMHFCDSHDEAHPRPGMREPRHLRHLLVQDQLFALGCAA